MIIDQLFTRPLFESQTDHITQFASNAHEEWRRKFDPTGTKPRIKKNSDGTEGDINVPFADLHPDWQKENLAAAHAAHRAVKHFGSDMEKAAEYVHNEWMKRNPKADYNAAQHVPYDDLPEDEKEKDRVHVRTMMRLMGHHPEQGVAEVAPPGAKAERMVKHIKQGYARDGKLTPQEKGIAYATAWKAHNAGRVEEQGVAEGFDKEAEAYKAHLLKTAPKVMDFLSKAVKGWRPSKEEMLGAIDTGYMVMKHTGDVKQAGKAMMDELNTLHRMSQGQQGVAEGSLTELSTEKLAQYKTAAAADAKQADQAGDVKRGDRRFSGIVKATKKQFDNDAKKINESRRARQALMAQIVNSR